MANRFTRPLPQPETPAFRPALPDGLLEVRRGAGQDDEALAQAGSQLGDIFGRFADEQAKIEGEREGKVAGQDPNWRPQGRATIRGRALEKAATETYAANLDAKIHKGLLEAFEANRDNPVGFNAAVDNFKSELLAADVFPELQGPVNAQIERTRASLRLRTADAAIENERSKQRAADFEARQSGIAMTNQVLGGDPRSPEVQQVIRDQIAAEDDRIQRGVASGAYSADQAAKLRQSFRTNLLTRVGIEQVERITTIEGVRAARAEFDKQRRAGDGPIFQNADATDAVDNALRKQEERLSVRLTKAVKALDGAGDDMVKRAMEGNPPSLGELTQFRTEAAQTPEGQAIAQRTERRLNDVRFLAARGPQEFEARLRDLRRQYGETPTPQQAEDLKFKQELLTGERKAIQTDAIRAGERRFGPINSLDMSTPQALGAGLRDRLALAKALGPQYNPNAHVFTQDEVEALKRTVSQGGPQAMQVVETIARSAGGDAPRVFRQIGGQAPELAQAGLLLASGGSRQAAADVLSGVALRNVDGGAKVREVNADMFGNVWKQEVGSSFNLMPEDERRIRQTAMTIAAFRLRNETDMKGATAQQVTREAIQEAIGRNQVNGERFGGAVKIRPGMWWVSQRHVPVPPDVRADRFGEVIGALRSEDLTAQPVPPAQGVTIQQVRQAMPVWAGNGYSFAMGDPEGSEPRWLRGADGKPFVLRWDTVSGRLRERVPGAFLGGGR